MNYAYSPYADAAQAFGRLGSSMDDIVLGLAQQKYQIAQAQEQMRFRRQQAAEENAMSKLRFGLEKQHKDAIQKHYETQDKLTSQKTQEAETMAQLGPEFGNVLEQIALAQSQPNSPRDSDALQGMLANVTGRLSAAGRFRTPVNAAQVMELQNPRMRALMATGAKPVQSIPSQSATVDPVSGMISEILGQKLNQGQVLVDANTGEVQGQGLPPRPTVAADPLQRQMGTLNNFLKANQNQYGEPVEGANTNDMAIARQVLSGIIQQMSQGTNAVARGPRAGLQSEAPEKSAARAEALELIKKYPDKASAIKARYQETFKEELK